MFKIRKKVRFEYAHILDSSYSKDCQQLHGHSAILEVFLKSDVLNADGMVMDFGELKGYLSGVIDVLDHKTIVSNNGPHCDSFDKFKVNNISFVNFNPTAENMCKWIYDELKHNVPQLYKIRIHETESGWASFSE